LKLGTWNLKYIDEYRDRDEALRLSRALGRVVTRPWTLMEVCGGQTHAIVKFGIDELLPESVTLIHGPGCPVCVTPAVMIRKSIAIARRPGVIFCTFGDMLRVPCGDGDLFLARAQGGDVRVVYAPLDAVAIARENPGRQVVFFAVGFETTAPATALAVLQAEREGLGNFSMLVSHVRVPPALEAILAAPDQRVQAFLAAGHVCTVMGAAEYEPIARRYGVPIVITGFEPVDLLHGVLKAVQQLERGEAKVENAYRRSARDDGNPAARRIMDQAFSVRTRAWRGIGDIPDSGLGLCERLADFDAERRFDVEAIDLPEDPDCRSGLVLQGRIKPTDCPCFGTRCTPEQPLGATMVSNEGACAAYYRYRPVA
jgi:hydrogenase expression/formation protein HypD